MNNVLGFILIIALGQNSYAGEFSCEKESDVAEMSVEIMSQLGCSGVKKLVDCSAMLGIAATAAPLVAIAALGINRTRAGMGKVLCSLPTRGGALWRTLLPEVEAKDCVGLGEKILGDVKEATNFARNEMYAAATEQDKAILDQLRDIHDKAIDNRYKGTPAKFEDSRIVQLASREYAESVSAIDRRYLGQMATEFDKLGAAHPDQAVRDRTSKLVSDLRQPLGAADDFRQYKSLDELMDLFKLERPSGRTIVSTEEKNPIRLRARQLYQDRILDISDAKRTLTNRINDPKISRPALGGPNTLAYTSVEEYEIAKLRAEADQYRSSVLSEERVTGEAGRLERGRLTANNGSGHFARRYPMLAEDSRLTYEFVHLGEQQSRLAQITYAYNDANALNLQATNKISMAAQRSLAIDVAEAKEIAVKFPRMPEGSISEMNKRILSARLESLERNGAYELTPSVIQRFGLQEVVAQARHLADEATSVGGRLLSGVWKTGSFILQRVAGPIGAGLLAVDVMAQVPGADKVLCEKPCSEFLTQDSHCEPTFSQKTVEFLKLETKSQLSEFKKCPQMCDAFKRFYGQALPTNKWSVTCPDGGSTKGVVLKSKTGKKRVSFDQLGGTSQIRLDDDESPSGARLAFVNNEEITSVRVPDTRNSAAMSPEGMKRTLAMTNPLLYHEVTAKQMSERPQKWWEQEAIGMQGLIKTLNYAKTEGMACCEMAAKKRDPRTPPGIERCAQYGVKVDGGEAFPKKGAGAAGAN